MKRKMPVKNAIGLKLTHKKFGEGTVVAVSETIKEKKPIWHVAFESGVKKLDVLYCLGNKKFETEDVAFDKKVRVFLRYSRLYARMHFHAWIEKVIKSNEQKRMESNLSEIGAPIKNVLGLKVSHKYFGDGRIVAIAADRPLNKPCWTVAFSGVTKELQGFYCIGANLMSTEDSSYDNAVKSYLGTLYGANKSMNDSLIPSGDLEEKNDKVA
ncbi:MAG: hypothetical protein Q4D21_03125 [Phascolarctobacterium sp.]|nr:hypothetical protein [Phascolarctobacterium sp.]